MSYSFTVRAADKAAAKAAVSAKLAEMVAQQPVHKVDQAQAEAVAHAFIDVLPDNDGKDVLLGMNGYVSGSWTNADDVTISAASVSVSASLIDRVQA